MVSNTDIRSFLTSLFKWLLLLENEPLLRECVISKPAWRRHHSAAGVAFPTTPGLRCYQY